jgi:hypothetical protein
MTLASGSGFYQKSVCKKQAVADFLRVNDTSDDQMSRAFNV